MTQLLRVSFAVLHWYLLTSGQLAAYKRTIGCLQADSWLLISGHSKTYTFVPQQRRFCTAIVMGLYNERKALAFQLLVLASS